MIISNVSAMFRDFADSPDPIDERLPMHHIRAILESRRRVGREAAWAELIRARAETKREIETIEREEAKERERQFRRQVDQTVSSAEQRAALMDLSDLDATTRARLIAIRQTGDLMTYAQQLGIERDRLKRK